MHLQYINVSRYVPPTISVGVWWLVLVSCRCSGFSLNVGFVQDHLFAGLFRVCLCANSVVYGVHC